LRTLRRLMRGRLWVMGVVMSFASDC
jgi:hypothetical protein